MRLFHHHLCSKWPLGFVLVCLLACMPLRGQDASVLAEGQWVKMAFTESGVYKIDFNTLSSAGFDPGSIDPRNISIFGNGGGMLPQANSEDRPLGLQENAIQVVGEEDGVFNSEDFILFYVDRVGEVSHDPTSNVFEFEKNLYSDEVYYFLTVRETPGKRVEPLASMGNGFPIVDHYNDLIIHEEDLHNILSSGRSWFGERFDSQLQHQFEIDGEGVAAGELKVHVKAMSQSLVSSTLSVSLDGSLLGEIGFFSIPDQRYGIKGDLRTGTYTLDASAFQNTANLSLRFDYNNNGASAARGFIDQFIVDLPRRLELIQGESLDFRSSAALSNTISTFQVQNASSTLQIWDVTQPFAVRNQDYSVSNNRASFGAFSDTLHEYIAFETDNIPLVSGFEAIANQDLLSLPTPDFLIITHEDFRSEAERLAQFRSEQDGLTVQVVDVNDIYNDFSSGAQDITALRDFVRHLYQKSDRLKYLLLFGKGSFDYKNRVEDNSNFVPTYEARNSLHPLLSFSSDDYFGFLDENEGQWNESRSGDHRMEIGIGRIPAISPEDARTAVDKIIYYQTSSQALGEWRNRLLFVADDGDNNIHQQDADELATLIDTTYADFNVQKLYLDAFRQERLPNGEVSPDAETALLNEIDRGLLILNFTGHGAENGWMQERILTLESIEDWNNRQSLPLLVTATCEFGRNDDPAIISGAEEVLFKEVGGAIGLVTTARPVFSSTNYDLNLALYGSILREENGEYPRLGDIIQFTKNNSLRGSLNRNFLLLGDPSMRLSYPKDRIEITSINGQVLSDENDTLRALQPVTIEGEIMSNGTRVSGFNGVLDITLFDKTETSSTLGTESAVFEFEERNSILFKGKATVESGQFRVEFVVPRNINFRWGKGKLSMYATNLEGGSDAGGANIDLVIGGTSDDAAIDSQAPDIQLFLNDTLNSQPFTKPSATLLARLFDESGINISNSSIGQEITATLNDSVTYLLNDFFSTTIDSFREGWVSFPLRDLPTGRNFITLKAWDIYNNSSTSTLEFIVTDENVTLITDISNFPNPFQGNTTFQVAHNATGEDIEMAVEIFNTRGEKITSLYLDKTEANSVENISWNGTNNEGTQLDKGIYIYQVVLRSKSTGKVHLKRKKLVISN